MIMVDSSVWIDHFNGALNWQVEFLRSGLANGVVLFLLGEACALAFFHGRNPAEVERLVWPWLLEWL